MSRMKSRLAIVNSPALFFLLYIRELCGSKQGLLPIKLEVDPVGIGATSRLLRTPDSSVASRRISQSYERGCFRGLRPSAFCSSNQRSNWNLPCDIGLPSKVL